MRLIDNSSKTNWNFVVIVVVLGLVFGSFALWYVNSTSEELSTVSIPKPTSTLQPQIDTSTWQTYRNDEFGFEFRYPADWQSDPGVGGVSFSDAQLVGDIRIEHAQISVNVGKMSEGFAEIWNSGLNGTKTIGGVRVLDQKVEDLSLETTRYSLVFGNNFYQIQTRIFDVEESFKKHSVSYYRDILDQILSTFRFVQKEGNNEQLGDAATKEECLAKAGVWQRWGLAQRQYCQIPAKDAGKSCTDQSQCTYGCISETGTVPGKCATYKNTFGCFSLVDNGRAEQALCVD